MILVKRLVTACLTAAALALFAGSAVAQEHNLKFSYWVPASHPLNPTGFQVWADSIREASKGSIDFTFFPSQQLGKAPDHYDMARDGIAEFTFIQPGYQAGRFPIIAAGELPFHTTNAVEGSRALDEWYRAYAETEMNEVKFCMVFFHDPGTFHSKTPIVAPADVEGLNVRPAHATMGRFVSLLGGSSVQVSAPEARDALSKGAADAITFPWNSIILFGIDKVTTHHLDMPFYGATHAIVMNKGAYESMSDANKKVIDDHCTSEWSQKVATGWAEWEADGRRIMAESGEHELHEPTAEQVQDWQKAAAPLVKTWKEDVAAKGVDADKAYADFVSTLEKYDSMFQQ